MPIVSLGPDTYDHEVDALYKILNRGGWMPHETESIRRAIRDRTAFVRAGLTSATARYWTSKIQKELDDRTRLRWDFKNGWTLDRWAEGCWQVVGVLGLNCVMPNLIEYLKENDMQRWPSPQAYLEYKRAKALKVQMDNWHRGNQKLGAVVDGMSDKQIKEFIKVERAMQVGENVVMRGQTKRMYDQLAEASRKSPAPPSGRAINPGHQFKVLTRKTGGKHRLDSKG